MVEPKVKAQMRWRALVIVLRLVLVAASVYALKREFAGLTPADLLRRLGSYSSSHVALGIAAMAASFVLLGGIEHLALRTQRPASAGVTPRIAYATAFIAHALSQSIGVALLTGTAVRLRSYARVGMRATDVAQASAVVTLTVTLGLLSVGGWALLARSLPVAIGGHELALRPVGALLCLTVVAWLVWSIIGRERSSPVRRWRIPRPAPLTALAQVALATADWLVTGAVLFAFIPPSFGLGLIAFLQLYIIAQLLGVLSHVPAGAGVFEIALLSLVTAANPGADRAGLLAAIVMYRAVYYILPLALAMLFAAGSEWRRLRRARLGARRPTLVGATSITIGSHGY